MLTFCQVVVCMSSHGKILCLLGKFRLNSLQSILKVYSEVQKSKIFTQKCLMAEGIHKSLFHATSFNKCESQP